MGPAADSAKHHPTAHGDRDHDAERRRLLLGLGWGGLAALFAAMVPGVVRFLWPGGRLEGTEAIEVGALQDYRNTLVTTRWVRRQGLWLIHHDGKLFALEARCTHLGCTPRWVPEAGHFHCPCHGSRFSTEGVALNGPATLPLVRLGIRLEGDRVVVDRSRQAPLEEAEADPRYFIRV